jgi:chemotaxis protein CheX
MDVKFLNPFLDSAGEVLRKEIQLEITKGPITVQTSALTTDDVTVLINLVGQIQGVVLYEMSTSTALSFVSRMMGQKFNDFDNLAQSGIAELGNVITGRASDKLSQAGFEATISPPTLIIGKGSQVSTLDCPSLIIPLSSKVGTITVHLAL